jgi:hypothetical protein
MRLRLAEGKAEKERNEQVKEAAKILGAGKAKLSATKPGAPPAAPAARPEADSGTASVAVDEKTAQQVSALLRDTKLKEGGALQRCGNGSCPNTNVKACSRCRAIAYCSANCQRSDWSRHRSACAAIGKMRREAEAEADSETNNERPAEAKTAIASSAASASGSSASDVAKADTDVLVFNEDLFLDDDNLPAADE